MKKKYSKALKNMDFTTSTNRNIDQLVYDALVEVHAINVITEGIFSRVIGNYWYIGEKEYEYLIKEHLFVYMKNLASLRLHFIITESEVFRKLGLPYDFHGFQHSNHERGIYKLPDEIGELSELITLDLSNTKIKKLPDSIVNLSKLEYLFLNNTMVEVIPSWIGFLPKLHILSLLSLSIHSIPKEIMNLGLEFEKDYMYSSWDKGIFIKNLSVATQPISLFYQPRELIQNYYDSSKIGLKVSKVLFVGEGGAGKSYTIQRIINNGDKPEKDTLVTHDIIIEHWNNSGHAVDYDGTIDFWDFGGQDIYLSMHRCFMTERSCYVIVLSNRPNGSNRGLMRQARYWLRNISAFVNDSPILIAINTWNGQQRDGLSLTQLKSEFQKLNIVDQIVYDAHDPERSEFNRLTSRICKMAQEISSYDLKFPISWANVRTRLYNEYSNENYISESDYYQICKEEMYEHDGYYDEEIARWLLHWFNDLGYCFEYHSIDEKTVGEEYQVLKPQWVIRAMYKIINHKIRHRSGNDMLSAEMLPQDLAKSKRDLEGRIAKDDIIDLLAEKSESGENYSEQEAEYIIRILRKYKLAYLIDDSESEELFIPALCSDLRPDTFDEVDIKYLLKTVYLVRFEYLPDTVMQHLMIKCFQEGKKLQKVWKNGFHLKVLNGCIVVEMLEDKEIVIKFYNLTKNTVCYGLHEMRTWLAEIYNNIGIGNTKDYIIKRTPQQNAFINVKALVNAYIARPKLDMFYTQDDDVYEGHKVEHLLKGLYGSSYQEIIELEVSENKKQGIYTAINPEYLSKRLSYMYVAELIEERFRTQFPKLPPSDEKEVQDHLQMFFDAQGYKRGLDYVRERGRVLFSIKEYVPDFALVQSKTVIEVKLLKDGSKKSRMIEEMNADYSAYTKEYNNIIYLVYDLGFISNVEEFKRDFEAKGNVKVVIIKH